MRLAAFEGPSDFLQDKNITNSIQSIPIVKFFHHLQQIAASNFSPVLLIKPDVPFFSRSTRIQARDDSLCPPASVLVGLFS